VRFHLQTKACAALTDGIMYIRKTVVYIFSAHILSLFDADRCMQFRDLSRGEKSVSSGMCVCLQGDCEIWCVKTGSQGCCKINLKAGEPRADFYSYRASDAAEYIFGAISYTSYVV